LLRLACDFKRRFSAENSIGSVLFHVCVIQSYQDAGHVISSYSFICIWRQNLLEQLLYARSYIIIFDLWLSHKVTHFFAAFFVGHAIPNTVTSQDDKLILLSPILLDQIGVGRDSLLLRCQLILIFVLEIAKCSAKRQVAIDPRIFDVMVRLLYTLQFVIIIWLVVLTQWHSLTISA
jgi:hypothetical protein